MLPFNPTYDFARALAVGLVNPFVHSNFRRPRCSLWSIISVTVISGSRWVSITIWVHMDNERENFGSGVSEPSVFNKSKKTVRACFQELLPVELARLS